MDANLSAVERRILKAVRETARSRITLESLAEKAKCKPDIIYKRLEENEEFNRLFKETMVTSLLVEVPEILHVFVEKAKEGSFKHGKLILDIAGVYEEKKKIDLNGTVNVEESPFASPEERREFLKATLARLEGQIVEEEEGKEAEINE